MMGVIEALLALLAAAPQFKETYDNIAAALFRNRQMTDDEWKQWRGAIDADLASPAFQPDKKL
jgi:hypothetical protein